MVTIKPFRAIRPKEIYASKVAALPYDVLSKEEAKEMCKNNIYSFLHVDKAEIDLPDNTDVYSDVVYNKAKENLTKLINDKILTKDDKDCFYIYELTMNDRTQTGLVVTTKVDEYLNKTIKKHELTREDKEIDRIKHVEATNANTGPIFLIYRENSCIKNIILDYIKNNKPIYDFVSEDNIRHKAFVIDDNNIINDLIQKFKTVDSLYIADGHHRNASAVKVALKKRQNNSDLNAEFNYYLSVLFPEDDLKIMDYNRTVKDLNGLSKQQFFDKLKQNFIIEQVQSAFKPCQKNHFGMYIDGAWYKLMFNSKINEQDIINNLDVSILQTYVLELILDIKDVRTDSRIDFIGGIRGLKILETKVDSGEMAVSFSLYPTTMKELLSVADNDLIMPPKSTWFEPKLRSGLFIHEL